MYDKLNTLAKNLVSKYFAQPDGEVDVPATLSRLQNIADRLNRQTTDGSGDQDGYLTGRLRHTVTLERDLDPSITHHWSSDTGRHQRQVIRQGEQLKGAQNCFEIDPIANLPD